MQEITKKIGNRPGPTTTIIAGIHGNEICGIQAFKKIINKVIIEYGVVFFILGNPRAIKKNIRQIDFNLNRMFLENRQLTTKQISSYEYARARKIKKILDTSDAMLDVHSSRNKKSIPFIITNKKNLAIAKLMPYKITSFGWEKIEPGGTDYYMNKKNKKYLTIECGYNLDKKAVDLASQSILQFIKIMGHIKNKKKFISSKQTNINVDFVYRTKTNKFKLKKHFADFEIIRAGQIIGTDADKVILAPKKSFIIFARDCDEVGSEAFILGKKMI
jgi:succinylglutamate desuccinylase